MADSQLAGVKRPSIPRALKYIAVGCSSIVVLLLAFVVVWGASQSKGYRLACRIQLERGPDVVWASIIDRGFQESSNDDLGSGFVRTEAEGNVVEMGPAAYMSLLKMLRTLSKSASRCNLAWSRTSARQFEPVVTSPRSPEAGRTA